MPYVVPPGAMAAATVRSAVGLVWIHSEMPHCRLHSAALGGSIVRGNRMGYGYNWFLYRE